MATGDLIYIVHGSNAHTWWRRLANAGYPWWRRWSLFCVELRQALERDCEVREFRWSGGNSHQARLEAGGDLARAIEAESRSRKTHIVGHSHGANVALAAVNNLQRGRVETLVLVAAPHIAISNAWLYWGNAAEDMPHIWNLYSPEDNVQGSVARIFHGVPSTKLRDVHVRRTYEGPGHGRVQNGVIHWDNPRAAHRAMHSAAVGAVIGRLLRGSTFVEAMKAAGLSADHSNSPRDHGGFPGLERTQQLIRKLGNPAPFDTGNRGSDIGILFIHGFTASPAEMRPMAEYVAHHTNWRCKAILLPGHGTTVDDMRTLGADDWIAAAAKAYDDLARECRHVFLAGMSLGGTICCHVALKRRTGATLRGMILIAPAFGISPGKAVGVHLVRRFIRLQKKNKRASDYFLDHRVYSYVHNPLNGVADLLSMGREAFRRLGELKGLPIVLFAGDLESTVSLEKMHAAARRNPWVRLLRLPNSRHILTLEPDREMMFEATVKFVEECLEEGVRS
jgi:carboxylesterase